MIVECALLCDAATIREGLLHILGGCVTTLYRPSFPAGMSAQLALAIRVHVSEFDRDHALVVIVQDADGSRIATAGANYRVDIHTQPKPLRAMLIPMVLPLDSLMINEAGIYSLEILIGGQQKMSIPFEAELIEAPQLEIEPPRN